LADGTFVERALGSVAVSVLLIDTMRTLGAKIFLAAARILQNALTRVLAI
jgi:hypothetical protein